MEPVISTPHSARIIKGYESSFVKGSRRIIIRIMA